MISLIVLLAGAAIALLQPSRSVLGYLSPGDTSPTGTHALADILAARGHGVDTVTTVPAAVGAATADSTLVVTSPYLLTASQLRELGRTRADLVVAEPDQDTLQALAPQVSLSGGEPLGAQPPGCPLRAAILAGPADLGGPGLHATPAANVTQCYPVGGLPTLVQIRSGGHLVTLLSSGAPLSNAYLARQGNAALAINLLSARGPVVWLVPQLAVPASGATSGSRPFTEPGAAGGLAGGDRARRGPAAGRPVAGAAAGPAGHRAASGGGAGLGDGRGTRPPLPVPPGPRPGGGHAAAGRGDRLAPAIGLPPNAEPAAVTAALAARSGRGSDGRSTRCCMVHRRAAMLNSSPWPVIWTPSKERYAGSERRLSRRHRGRPGVTDQRGEGDPRAPLGALRAEVAKAVVGQDQVVSGLVIALLCQGHVLLEGVPGVAKTLLVRSLAAALSLDSKRVQFTPDLMPGDVTGSLIYDARTARFEFREGPVFTNLLLADEINRTPPKTQAALLEAMEERQVSVEGEPRPLPVPFLVAATQNPVEYEGTYPLPEAQLDRFLLKLTVALPERAEEISILTRHATGFDPRDLGAAGLRQVAERGRPGRRPPGRGPGPRRRPRSPATSSTSAGPPGSPPRCGWACPRAARRPCWAPAGPGPGWPAGTT